MPFSRGLVEMGRRKLCRLAMGWPGNPSVTVVLCVMTVEGEFGLRRRSCVAVPRLDGPLLRDLPPPLGSG